MTSERLRRPGQALATRRWALLWVVLVFGAVGCSGGTSRITGIVRFDGQPLTSGRVTFLCNGKGRPTISASISSDGSYWIDKAPVGRAQVSVKTFPVPAKPKPGVDPLSGVDYEAEWVAEWGNAGPYVPIPSRYASPTSSGLEVTIGPGEQTFDIDLTQ